ncbi:hypothetical protein RRG08_049840 [Elysia crispata]|uniref:Uncharacterized protein n=1 Tax=Elysia crispata TaxID=231223 RepID=A0AAE0ZUH6_9GAST|nr:hypothetical protein RRG08_049840 [Elysia crispata]
MFSQFKNNPAPDLKMTIFCTKHCKTKGSGDTVTIPFYQNRIQKTTSKAFWHQGLGYFVYTLQKCGQYDHPHRDLKEKQKNLLHKSYKILGTLDGSLATALEAQFFIVPPTESHKDLPCPAPK